MSRYRVLEKSFIHGKIVEAGEIVHYVGAPGSNLQLLDGEPEGAPSTPPVPAGPPVSPLPGIALRGDGKYIGIWCEGCKQAHAWIPLQGTGRGDGWSWDGRTLSPSVRHFVRLPEDEGGGEITTCHYNVTNGRIFYHADSTCHSLRGEHNLRPFPPDYVL